MTIPQSLLTRLAKFRGKCYFVVSIFFNQEHFSVLFMKFSQPCFYGREMLIFTLIIIILSTILARKIEDYLFSSENKLL